MKQNQQIHVRGRVLRTSISALSIVLAVIICPSIANAQVKKCTNAEGKVTYAQGNCPKATVKDQTTMQYTPVNEGSSTAAANSQEEKNLRIRDQLQDLNTKAKTNPKTYQHTSVTPLRDGSILVRTTKVTTN